MIRLGYLTYLNVAPFYWGSQQWEVELIPCVPSLLGQLAARGQVDAGPIAVADWFTLESDLEPIGAFGIASQRDAQSVLLFSSRPIEELNNAIVGVTHDTSTSVRLLQLLLERRYGVSPREYRRGERGEAWLLIGDAALSERKRNPAPFVYDLGEEWWRWQKLPFVFARWVMRRALPDTQKAYLHHLLHTAFETGMAQLQDVAAQHAGQGTLETSEIITYLSNFTYQIGELEEQGLAKFKQLLLDPSSHPSVHDATQKMGA
jgi:chorismate dehydratase